MLNTTVTNPSTGGYVTVYPSGTTAPNASNLNFLKGQTVPNLVAVKTGVDGKINLLHVSAGGTGSTDLIADPAGYYNR